MLKTTIMDHNATLGYVDMLILLILSREAVVLLFTLIRFIFHMFTLMTCLAY